MPPAIPNVGSLSWPGGRCRGPLLLAAVVSAALFLVTVPAPDALATPGLPLQARAASFPLLAGIPWMLAAGWMGPAQASLAAFLGGWIHAGWNTHSLLTPVSAGLQAALAAWLLRRDYPDALGRAARQPLVAAIVSGAAFGGLRCLELYFYSGGGLYDGLAYVSGLVRPTFQAALLQALVAGIGAEIARTMTPARWNSTGQAGARSAPALAGRSHGLGVRRCGCDRLRIPARRQLAPGGVGGTGPGRSGDGVRPPESAAAASRSSSRAVGPC